VPSLYYGSGSPAAMVAAQRQASVWQRQLREAASDATRLNLADRFYGEGNIRAAATLYARVAMARPATPASLTAKHRLNRIGEEARNRSSTIDTRLKEAAEAISPSDLVDGATEAAAALQPLFDDYAKLVDQYGAVAGVGSDLKKHVAAQRRKPEYAAVLNEAEARKFWDAGQARERDNELCCAYWFYTEAARLVPARSALLARSRLDEMKADPAIVAAAQTCRELQWCHDAFQRATMLRDDRPERARELLAEITTRSPADSEVHRAARDKLAEWQ